MIGERLLDLRKDKGMTQAELAEILNTNKHSISAYERDKNEPSDDMKIQIAHFFQVSVDYLLGLTNIPNPYGEGHNCLKLPENFPPEGREDLKDYIRYLVTVKYAK